LIAVKIKTIEYNLSKKQRLTWFCTFSKRQL